MLGSMYLIHTLGVGSMYLMEGMYSGGDSIAQEIQSIQRSLQTD